MKSTFKRVISVLLAAALFLSASPVVELSEFDFLSFKASAASYKGTCGDNLEWELDISYGVLTITGTGDMTVWAQKENVPWRRHVSIIKSVVIENGVTNIGAHAFSDCKYIKSISISDTVININATFNTCTALSAITVAENNTVFSSDEYGVLFNKDKTRVIRCPIANPMANYTVPESVTGIDGFAFYQCANLESIALSDAVTSIGGNAFTGTAFYNNSENWENGTLYIGNHLIYVDNKFSGELVLKGSTLTFAQYAVSGCYYITAIRIDGESEIYSTDEYGVLFNKDKTELIKYPPASTAESWHMPLSVKRIASEALSSTDNLTSLYYDGTYEQWNNMDIQQYFYFDTSKIVFECNSERPYRLSDLTSSIEWKLYTDGELVISGTGEMYDYYDYSDIEYIPWYDYSYSVKKIVICDGITYIGDNAFAYCSNATSVSIHASVTQMGNSPFY